MNFVHVNKDGKFHIDSETKSHLYNIKGPLQIVSVVGRYRTGKSSLLNHLSGSNDFTTSSSVQAQTKGLGIHILNEKTQTICLIDSEGFGSVQASKTHDTSIFALAMLVSSGCFFNSIGTITSQNLRDLRLAAQVAGIITSSSKIGVSMPPIVWILRDFVLQLRDTHGFIMSPSEYLEDCINQSDEKDNLSSDIRTLFPERDAMTVPRPCDTEEDLQNMTNIKPAFHTAMKDIRSRMLNFPPKTRQNRILDGRELCDLVEALCEVLNTNGTIPNMDDMWAAIVQKSLEHATALAKSTFLAEHDICSGVREAYDVFKTTLGQIKPTADNICELTLEFLAHTEKLDASKIALLDLQHSSKIYKEHMEESKLQLVQDISTLTERSSLYESRLQDMVTTKFEVDSLLRQTEDEKVLLTQQLHILQEQENEHSDHIQERFQQLRKARDTLQLRVDQLKAEKDQLTSRYEDVKHQFESVNQKLLSFRKRNDSSETQIADMHREIRELKTDAEVWKTRYNDTMTRQSSQNNITNTTQLELLSIKAEVEYLRKTKTEQDNRISSLYQENSGLRHDVKKLQLFKSSYV